MKTKSDAVAAGEFKAKCLKIMDKVAKYGETYVITKRGKPIAKIVPIEEPKRRSLIGSVTILGDIVGPACEDWPCDENDDLY